MTRAEKFAMIREMAKQVKTIPDARILFTGFAELMDTLGPTTHKDLPLVDSFLRDPSPENRAALLNAMGLWEAAL